METILNLIRGSADKATIQEESAVEVPKDTTGCAKRPKLPFDDPPKTWEDFRQVAFSFEGSKCNKSKRKTVVCAFCNTSIHPSKATKEHLLKHLYLGYIGETGFPHCKGLREDEKVYIKGYLCTISGVGQTLPLESCSEVSSLTVSPVKKTVQSKLTVWAPKPLSEEEQNHINRSLTLMFATSGVSFRLADNRYFKILCSMLRPGYAPLTAKVVSSTALTKEYDTVMSALRERISQADCVNLLLDGWTDLRFRSIYAFIISFPKDGKEYLFDVKDVSLHHHTGQFLEQLMESVIWDIEGYGSSRKIKVNAVVTDNASNMKLARETLVKKGDFKHIFCLRCFMHAFSNVLNKILQQNFASELVQRAKNIVTYCKSSHLPAALLREKQYLFEDVENSRGLVSANKTRMTSVQLCIASVLNNFPILREIVDQMGDEFRSAEVKADILNFTFHYQLQELHGLILPFAKCTMAIQGKISRLSDVARYWIYLTNSVDSFLQKNICIPGVEGFKADVAKIFNDATKQIPVTTSCICLYLDPRYRSTLVKKQTVLEALQLQIVKTAQGRGVSDDNIRKIIRQLAAYSLDASPFNIFPFGGADFDPRFWWESKCSETSEVVELARIAVMYFSIPASAAAPERTFSTFDWYQAKRRNRIGARKLAMLATIKQFHDQEELNMLGRKKRSVSHVPQLRKAQRTESQESASSATATALECDYESDIVHHGDAEYESCSDDELNSNDDQDQNSSSAENDLMEFDEENIQHLTNSETQENRDNSTARNQTTYSYGGPPLLKLAWFDYSDDKFSLEPEDYPNEVMVASRRTLTVHPVAPIASTLSDTALKQLIADANLSL